MDVGPPLNDFDGKIELGSQLAVSYAQSRSIASRAIHEAVSRDRLFRAKRLSRAAIPEKTLSRLETLTCQSSE
jgi:hypothetical protein